MARKRKLTEAEKAARARERLIEKAREYQIGTYTGKFVAPVFQRMIRAEAAAKPAGEEVAIVDGEPRGVFRRVGQCVCVTCGKRAAWQGHSQGGGVIETGHFVAGRRAAILFEENNAHPQCKHCNRHLGGNQGCYEQWMRHVYGQEEIDRLRRLRNEAVQFTREELVDLRLGFAERLASATDKQIRIDATRR